MHRNIHYKTLITIWCFVTAKKQGGGKRMDKTIIIHTLNNNQVRSENVDGREYLVSPVVAVKAGVLNGMLAPEDELKEFYQVWNDVPVPVGHPKRNGKNVSSRHLEVVNNDVLGRFYNAEWDGDKLKGEIWIDVKKAENIADENEEVEEALEAIRNESQINVSTSYFSNVEMAKGVYNGEEYEGIQRNIRPDHLALLPNQKGACSLEDGCGTPMVNHIKEEGSKKGGKLVDDSEISLHKMANRKINNQLEMPRTPEYDGTEDMPNWSDVPLTLTSFREAYHEYSDNAPDDFEDIPSDGWSELSQDARDWIASKSLLGDPNANNLGDGVVLPVVNPNTNNLNENGLDGALSRAPMMEGASSETINAAQAKARTLLNEEFDREIEAEKEANNNFTKKVANAFTEFIKENIDKIQKKVGEDMQSNEKQELINNIKNCKCNEFTEEELSNLSKNQLYTINQGYEVTCDESDKPEGNSKDGSTGNLNNNEGGNNKMANEEAVEEEEKLEEAEGAEEVEEEEKKEENKATEDVEAENEEAAELNQEAAKQIVARAFGVDVEEFENMKSQIENMKKKEENQRKDLAEELKENSSVDFTDEELENLNTNTLKKIKKATEKNQPANYLGNGLNNFKSSNEDNGEERKFGTSIEDFSSK